MAGTATPRTKLTEKQRRFVVAFVGPARGSATEAASLAGYKTAVRRTLTEIGRENLSKPVIAAEIEASFASFRDEGASDKRIRLSGKQERLTLLWRVIDERARRYAAESAQDAAQAARSIWGQGVPVEAATGLLAKKETRTGKLVTTEWVVDVAMLKEMRELERDIAEEVGEAGATLRVQHSGTVRHAVRDYSALSDAELDNLIVLAEKVDAGAVMG